MVATDLGGQEAVRAPIVLRASRVRKTFGGVTALDDVDFALRDREIHGLVGQNGAGKSTLVKILNGVHQPDAGSLELRGRPLPLSSPSAARLAGMAMVFQEFSLIPTLSVADNIFLTHEPRRRGGLIDAGAAARRTAGILRRLGVAIDPRELVGNLPVGSQQLVEIAKAMSRSPSILILDEPTASLSQGEIETLFSVLRALREQGVSTIYISHHLQEVLTVCDTITVLRDGRVHLSGPAQDLGIDDLVTAITGTRPHVRQHRIAHEAIDRARSPVVEVTGWTLGERLRDVALAIHPAEVVGVAGLLGSGRSSLLRSIVGLERDVAGTLRLHGEELRFASPSDALKRGVAFVPEDRRRQGTIAGQSVQANLLLTMWGRLAHHFLIDEARARDMGDQLIARLDVRTSGQRQLVDYLSGGNQQKVVVGRSLSREPELLLLDDPTAGIDIGARRDLLAHVRRFADGGGAVLIVSSELDDLSLVADRVVILARGSVVRILDPSAGDALDETSLLGALHIGEAEAAEAKRSGGLG